MQYMAINMFVMFVFHVQFDESFIAEDTGEVHHETSMQETGTTADVLTCDMSGDMDYNNDLCFICKTETPPVNAYKGRSKGRGKGKGVNIDWVGCDHCVRWFHCICAEHKLLKGANVYKCQFC